MFVSIVERKEERGGGAEAGTKLQSLTSSGIHANGRTTNNVRKQTVCCSEIKATNIKNEHEVGVITMIHHTVT